MCFTWLQHINANEWWFPSRIQLITLMSNISCRWMLILGQWCSQGRWRWNSVTQTEANWSHLIFIKQPQLSPRRRSTAFSKSGSQRALCWMESRHRHNFDSSPEVRWQKEQINEAREEDAFEKVLWWDDGKEHRWKIKITNSVGSTTN
jgi:hypothetical protein